jgi:hypothetical protein
MQHQLAYGIAVQQSHANPRLVRLRTNEIFLYRKDPNTRKQVAAVLRGADDVTEWVDLEKEVIDINPGFSRRANNRDFAGQGVSTANTVHLQGIRPAHDPEEQSVALEFIRWQMLLQEIGTA